MQKEQPKKITSKLRGIQLPPPPSPKSFPYGQYILLVPSRVEHVAEILYRDPGLGDIILTKDQKPMIEQLKADGCKLVALRSKKGEIHTLTISAHQLHKARCQRWEATVSDCEMVVDITGKRKDKYALLIQVIENELGLSVRHKTLNKLEKKYKSKFLACSTIKSIAYDISHILNGQ